VSEAAGNETKLTILHLDSGKELRGGQWQVLRLMRGLRRRGHKVMIAARAKSPLFDICLAEHFPCDVVGWDSVRWISRKADIVHAHDGRTHTLAALFSQRPFVVSRRVVFPVKRNPLSRWKYSRPKMYAAVSLAVGVQLKKAGVPERRIQVIYDGVPQLPDDWSFGGHVVAPRFSDERKGATLPADAAAQAGVPLIWSTNLEADLKDASMLLYLTYSEGLGSAAILAMSAGVPVVASNVGGLREVVRHGETGLLVPNDARMAADAIRLLKHSREMSQAMSRRAREVASEVFGEDRMVDETLALYKRVLNVA
jgi:hypothetical protein